MHLAVAAAEQLEATGVVPEAAVRRVSDAADVNGDGVIQWAEFYFAGTELAAVIDAAAEKSGEA